MKLARKTTVLQGCVKSTQLERSNHGAFLNEIALVHFTVCSLGVCEVALGISRV